MGAGGHAAYPAVKFIVGHITSICAAGGEDYLELAGERRNVFLDLASSVILPGMLERITEKAGVEKVLFGTDFPFVEAAVQLGSVLWAEISEASKVKIFGANMAKILGLPESI